MKKKEKKYCYNVTENGSLQEKCPVHNPRVMIGSHVCMKCRYLIEASPVSIDKPWIICSMIDGATGKKKINDGIIPISNYHPVKNHMYFRNMSEINCYRLNDGTIIGSLGCQGCNHFSEINHEHRFVICTYLDDVKNESSSVHNSMQSFEDDMRDKPKKSWYENEMKRFGERLEEYQKWLLRIIKSKDEDDAEEYSKKTSELYSKIKEDIYPSVVDSRMDLYGDPVNMFRNVSMVASVLTGLDLKPEDCVKVLMALKISREGFKHNDDNLVDLKGYVDILEMLNK